MAFLAEVRRRGIVKVSLAYLALAWLVIQVGATVLPVFGAPAWVLRAVIIAFALGFPIALILAWRYELTPEGVRRDSGPDSVAARPKAGRTLDFAIIAVLVLALAVLVVDRYMFDDDRASPDDSIAVLPFTNDSPDPEQQYFADGLSGELINALSRIPDLAVAGRASSFYFKGKNESLATIGNALHVEQVLNGGVQRSGDTLRITAELVSVDTGRPLWSKTYERTVEDIFAIQDDITREVAEVLQITLGVGRLGRVPGMPRNVAAYEELLKGAGYLRDYRPDSFQPAIDHFLRATQIEESSSAAWMSLANAYLLAASNVPERAAEWLGKANEAADRARALTPQGLGVLLWDARRSINRGAWSEAAVFFDEQLNEEKFPLLAREYGPNSELWAFKAFFLQLVGRIGEAISYWEQARSADPLLPGIAQLLGDAYADMGDYSAAFAELDRGLRLESLTAPLQGYAVAAALGSGDREEIDRRLAALGPSPATDAHLRMAAFLDDPAGAVTELHAYLATAPTGPDLLTPLVFAHWAGYYDDPSAALALLRRIPRQFFTGDVALAIWRPVFSDMRSLPEFTEFVRELGFVDYWREHGWPDFCEPVGETFTCH